MCWPSLTAALSPTPHPPALFLGYQRALTLGPGTMSSSFVARPKKWRICSESRLRVADLVLSMTSRILTFTVCRHYQRKRHLPIWSQGCWGSASPGLFLVGEPQWICYLLRWPPTPAAVSKGNRPALMSVCQQQQGAIVHQTPLSSFLSQHCLEVLRPPHDPPTPLQIVIYYRWS